MATQEIVPQIAPKRPYQPRLSTEQRTYQTTALEACGLLGEFQPGARLVGELATALVKARKRRGYIREIIRDVAKLFSK
jgi:hypothetical protein